MKKTSLLLLIAILGCKQQISIEESLSPTFGIVVHGGAGTILKENMTPVNLPEPMIVKILPYWSI